MRSIGIDIGTTNIKFLLFENGAAEVLDKRRTPVYTGSDGAEYFDIGGICGIVDEVIEKNTRNNAAVISCVSVGESVIPVASGAGVCDPLLWCDSITEAEYHDMRGIIERYADRSVTGINADPLFSIFKMRYQARRFSHAEFWLPVSSYILYHRTGAAAYDYTQASRTMLLDIQAKAWNVELLQAADIPGQMPPIKPYASYMGADGLGNRYYLGGHDHTTAYTMFIDALNDEHLIMDSIGTSESMLCTIPHTASSVHSALSASVLNSVGLMGDGHKCFVLLAFTYSGQLFAELAKKHGLSVNELCGTYGNARALHEAAIAGAEAARYYKSYTFIGETPSEQLANLYAYLSSRAASGTLILEQLSDAHEPPVLVVGSSTHNAEMMRYRASAMPNRVITTEIRETGGLSAAYCAIKGFGDTEELCKMRGWIGERMTKPEV